MEASLRIAVDGGTNFLPRISTEQEGDKKEYKIPDIICGDFDSVDAESLKWFEKKGSKIMPTPDQDETDFTKAVIIAQDIEKERGHPFDIILAVNTIGGRPDQLLSNFHTLHKFAGKSTPIILYDIGNSISWVLSAVSYYFFIPSHLSVVLSQQDARHRIHQIPIPEGSEKELHWCSLVPLTGSSAVVTSGLRWNLEGQMLKFGHFISTSNEFEDSSVSIESSTCLLWSMKDDCQTK
jgi:thiamine pyrophosphokinase